MPLAKNLDGGVLASSSAACSSESDVKSQPIISTFAPRAAAAIIARSDRVSSGDQSQAINSSARPAQAAAECVG